MRVGARLAVGLLLLVVVGQVVVVPGWVPPAGAAGPCPSDPPASGPTNPGFETGDLTGWTADPSAAVVTGADGFATPFEGSSMLRLGTPAADADQPQATGPVVVCQELTVHDPVLDLAVALFTYDHTGFDRFEIRVSDVVSGDALAVYEQRGWGAAAGRKTSGWVGARLDLSTHVGDLVRLELTVEGTGDDRYASWAYVDSAEAGLPTPPVTVDAISSAQGTAVIDPVSGAVAVTQPPGSNGDLTVVAGISCPGGGAPSAVELGVGGLGAPMHEAVPGSGRWTGTLSGDTDPPGGIPGGRLAIGADCPGAAVLQAVGDVHLAASPPTFTDVAVADPFWLEITWAAYRGIAAGYPDGTYRPGDAVTRQAWAAFATRLGDPPPAVPPCVVGPHPDVGPAHPFCGEIAWVGVEELMAEYADGTFRPTGHLTRQAAATILYRMAGAPDGADPGCPARPYPDVPVGSPFCGAIAWAVTNGLVIGFDDGTFRPGATVTRQAAAAFLLRFVRSTSG